MISVCCCVINGRYDVEFMVEFLEQHNDPSEFEVCLCHDDRVDDHSAEYFDQLKAKYSNFKVIVNSQKDTIEYLEKLVKHYEDFSIFDSQFTHSLRTNLEKYKSGQLLDPSTSFLWLTSGLLYNKAASIASGDILVVTPGDFVHLFKMRDLETYVRNHSRDGFFYSKPNAIWARIGNLDPKWMQEHVEAVHNGLQTRPDFRWDTNQIYRSYLNCPSKLSDYNLADFKNKRLINMCEPNFEKFYDYNRYAHSPNSGIQASQSFHGFHIMTKKSYDAIGGFTEIFYGRAFGDDQMTLFGKRHFGIHQMPAEFSVGWIGMHECLDGVGPPLPEGWRELLKQKEPFWDKHPIAGISYGHVHLHRDAKIQSRSGKLLDHPNHVHQEAVEVLASKYKRPVRIGT